MGRNDPCHCGSGKKYKKCCLDADEAARPRVVERDGDRFHVSPGVSESQFESARQYFREKDEGRGPAAQMAEYAKPLIDSTDGSFEAMQKALNIGMTLLEPRGVEGRREARGSARRDGRPLRGRHPCRVRGDRADDD